MFPRSPMEIRTENNSDGSSGENGGTIVEDHPIWEKMREPPQIVHGRGDQPR